MLFHDNVGLFTQGANLLHGTDFECKVSAFIALILHFEDFGEVTVAKLFYYLEVISHEQVFICILDERSHLRLRQLRLARLLVTHFLMFWPIRSLALDVAVLCRVAR